MGIEVCIDGRGGARDGGIRRADVPQRTAEIARLGETDKRLGVDPVVVPHRQPLYIKRSVEPRHSRRAGRIAAPAGECAGDHRAAGGVDNNDLCAENSGDRRACVWLRDRREREWLEGPGPESTRRTRYRSGRDTACERRCDHRLKVGRRARLSWGGYRDTGRAAERTETSSRARRLNGRGRTSGPVRG